MAQAIDAHGFILVASMDCALRVYDIETLEVVQQHIGHSDAVRCIIHINEKQQYLTASWDRTIRVWRAYTPTVKHHDSTEVVEEGAPGSAEATSAATGEASAGGGEGGEDEEEEFVPYSVRFPLIEPKCLADRGKSSGDKFMRKVTEKEGGKGKGKKGADDDPLSNKPPQGLAAELTKLEERLKHELLSSGAEARGGAGTDRRGGRRQGGMAARGGAAGRPSGDRR